jgi:hypothetical protein
MVIVEPFQGLPEKPEFVARILVNVLLQGFFHSPPRDISSSPSKTRLLSRFLVRKEARIALGIHRNRMMSIPIPTDPRTV